jgi:hypothetical protein
MLLAHYYSLTRMYQLYCGRQRKQRNFVVGDDWLTLYKISEMKKIFCFDNTKQKIFSAQKAFLYDRLSNVISLSCRRPLGNGNRSFETAK